jgi:hypothetical protein
LLLNAIVDALAESGINATERLDHVRRQEHSIVFGVTDLLEYYYCSAAQQPHELTGLKWVNSEGHLNFDMRYYRAYWPESRFIFVGEAGCAVRLCLTCRLPNLKPPEGMISVVLNEKPQVEILINNEWSSWEITLPGDVVRDGLNEVTVRWPIPEFDSGVALKKVVRDMCAMKFPEFYPVFGEIHSFTAARGKEVSTSLTGAERELAAPSAA